MIASLILIGVSAYILSLLLAIYWCTKWQYLLNLIEDEGERKGLKIAVWFYALYFGIGMGLGMGIFMCVISLGKPSLSLWFGLYGFVSGATGGVGLGVTLLYSTTASEYLDIQ